MRQPSEHGFEGSPFAQIRMRFPLGQNEGLSKKIAPARGTSGRHGDRLRALCQKLPVSAPVNKYGYEHEVVNEAFQK